MELPIVNLPWEECTSRVGWRALNYELCRGNPFGATRFVSLTNPGCHVSKEWPIRSSGRILCHCPGRRRFWPYNRPLAEAQRPQHHHSRKGSSGRPRKPRVRVDTSRNNAL
ncbi:hypothetical protein BC938DRAFT_481252 [Jimgerdemannia flammicorona]|uniref:Uncharacterized protein n=1 Tax=Jimgerdemannia flammicorona TaxID=994334 RepID=A0A433QH87_9FUNG|nr:hypothetical protein BC938DRAFT_481252 [Jimgerdemannia flammicorona]